MASSTAAGQQQEKLTGRAFYKSLGSPKYILAPMVDHSEAAWRILTRSFIPDSSKNLIAYSPMLHSRLFSNTTNMKYRAQNFEPRHERLASVPDLEQTSEYLDGHPVYDRPLIVQFCSNSPEDLLAAARYVQPFCDAVDLNLGCPQGIAKKGHYGSYLQEDWDLIYKLINKLHTELSIPVTAKMRVLETNEETLEYAKMILSAGASIITVHGRQRHQKGHYTGLADWSVIRYLREQLPPDTVIFANGNILQHGDMARCLRVTGADGIMSAEGSLADPTIFAQPPPIGHEGREYWRGRDARGGFRMDAVLRRYMDIIYRYVLECDPPERRPLFTLPDLEQPQSEQAHTIDHARITAIVEAYRKRQPDFPSVNLRVMQSHLFHMLRPLVAKHTDIRDCLAKCRVGDMVGYENIVRLVEAATKQGLIDYEKDDEHSTSFSELVDKGEVDDEAEARSSDAAVQRCIRPWFICQPHVRPLPQEAIQKGAITLSKKQKIRHVEDDANIRAVGLTPGGKLAGESMNDGKDQITVQIPRQGMVSG